MTWNPTYMFERMWQSGSIPDGLDQGVLWQIGITYIVNLAGDRDNIAPNYPEGVVMTHIHWRIDDAGLPDLHRLAQIANRVAMAQRAGEKILVHCAAGINRSSLVTGSALWLLGVADPFTKVRQMKPDTLSNSQFAAFLQSPDTLRYTLGNSY